ncbi:hypothetical protein INT44_008832 [Umbelopsis vinacea]|uniref:Uncharacterized protein n=1 Tax=Umbelopsis vinacea TaxID=44442 RepID=A0A8H7Q106_9FUNG|nr:hypothetical protein INT44_008832 [Umbelopsis vinacea]
MSQSPDEYRSDNEADARSSSGVVKLYIENDSFVFTQNSKALRLTFIDCEFKSLDTYEPPRDVRPFEVYGILGIVNGVRDKYLVIISSVQLRGHMNGSPIYAIDKVICLDLDHHRSYRRLANRAKGAKANSDIEIDVSDTESDDVSSNNDIPEVEVDTSATASIERPPSKNLGKGLVPVGRPSLQGARTHSFLNKMKQTFSTRPKVGSDTEADESKYDGAVDTPAVEKPEPDFQDYEDDVRLDKRMVKEVQALFSGQTFFFSPSFDITNTFERKYSRGPIDSIPLHKLVDRRFWWNEHMLQPLLTKNLDDWIVPVMQGAVQIEGCEMEGFDFTFILISRRSRERAGMRYQRRGINEAGDVANFVETEEIVLFGRDDETHTASFVQTRGSIPLYWSQSPYSLHPIPVLDRPEAENEKAIELHFDKQKRVYGRQIIVNLAELAGRESIVGAEYRRLVEKMADPNIKYVEFDFHRETKGMKFENIAKLNTQLTEDFSKMGYFWQTNNSIVLSKQNGVFRTNCMDCLDRTNVVQSAFARSIMNTILMRFGISEYPDQGFRFYPKFETVFNNVWANNGDSISREYAGTSALKGDFTRTGKRNVTGMMNDASNSLTRMYHNTIRDFWRQATVDYVLGYHKVEIFRHVTASTLMSAEPGNDKRWVQVRANAVQVSSAIVIPDGEHMMDGWTLLSPSEPNKLNTKSFEEKVVLLTEKAVYICSFNYHLEKVVQFRRIALSLITGIRQGEYILSTLNASSRDAEQNYGFVLDYEQGGESVRMNVGAIRNESLKDISIDHEEKTESSDDEDDDDKAFIAFKAVRYNVFGELSPDEVLTGREQVIRIVDKIHQAAKSQATIKEPFVTQAPIISLMDALKAENIITKVGQRIKKAIWL